MTTATLDRRQELTSRDRESYAIPDDVEGRIVKRAGSACLVIDSAGRKRIFRRSVR